MPKKELLSMSVEETAQRFRGKWVVMEVTAYEEHGGPSSGRILFTGSEKKAWKKAEIYLRANPDPKLSLYIYWAQPHLKAGELSKALDELMELPDPEKEIEARRRRYGRRE